MNGFDNLDSETPTYFSIKEKEAKRRRRVIINVSVVVAVVLIALAIGLGVGLTRSSGSETVPKEDEKVPVECHAEEFSSRIDCYPESSWGDENVTEEDCTRRGCTYNKTDCQKFPSCYVGPDSPLGRGFRATREDVPFEFGQEKYRYKLSPSSSKNDSKRTKRSLKLADEAVFEVEYGDESVMNFKLWPSPDGRFEVPPEILKINLPKSSPGKERRYILEVTSTDPLVFQIRRKSTGAILWDTSVGGLALSDQFLSISTRLPSSSIYGFGENTHQTFKHDLNFRTWPMFARDQQVGLGVHNNYGVHPFYMCLEKDGNAHGVLLLNSNAMDYSLTPLPMLTYRTIGGILNFYIFLGPSPENVIQQYTQLIGRPYMPPYWSLGFQLCRYGYNSLEKLAAAVDRTQKAGIPQDVQYADIDHMNERMDFTIDNTNFNGLPEYFQKLRDNGMRTIIILDPALITNVSGYRPYELGRERDIFVRWPNASMTPPADFKETNSTIMLGYVWPKGKVVFPDFFLPQTAEVWEELIVEHRKKLPFDGLWIDMNEPANFGTNEERPWNWPEDATPYWSLNCPVNNLEDPEYRTMAAYVFDDPVTKGRARLSDKTLCMVASFGPNGSYKHYDVHNLYGASQILPTLNALRNATGERGIVVSRSTFPGSGHTAGHWLGDNFSTWQQMRESIVGMLEFNLFGIPYIGADICGFFLETTPQLCKRWMQLGAFYPYSRNHNQADNKIDQDPGNFEEDVVKLSREAMLVRYHLLPYLYTLFHAVHTRGGTVVRSLWHEFPRDDNTTAIDEQFLWGSSLLITPILYENATNLTYYIPAGRWYDFYTNTTVHNNRTSGNWFTVDVDDNSAIPLFVRGGSILVTQDPANNTHFSRQNDFHVKIYLDDAGQAIGELFWDDGVSIDTYKNGAYYYSILQCSKNTFRLLVDHDNISNPMTNLKSIDVIGITGNVSEVRVGDSDHSDFSFSYERLVVNNLDWNMSQPLSLRWSSSKRPKVEDAQKIDCMPEGGIETDCQRKGCIWESTNTDGVPNCYINSSSYGYRFHSNVTSNDTYESLLLVHASGSSMFGGDSLYVKIDIDRRTCWYLGIKIYPITNGTVYEVPVPLFRPSVDRNCDGLYEVEYEKNGSQPFYIKIKRKDSEVALWDTSIGGLTVSEQFLQLATRVPTTYLYGLGEKIGNSYRNVFNNFSIPMFSRDQPPGGMNANLYGVHPYYLCTENVTTGSSHGVLLLNSNAMEVILSPAPAVIYRTTGGLLDFHFVFAENPEAVTSKYTELIGRPYMPPYWSLGFQLSRYGYDSLDNMKAAVDRTLQANIPLDVQYGDIDHMENQKDFTIDAVNFAGLQDFVHEIKGGGMRFIIILDPAIVAIDPTYWPYIDGDKADIFIRWPEDTNHSDFTRFNSTRMYGYVWPPGETLFPDFLRPAAHDWWKNCIYKHYHESLTFDGLWIDMNEPANFDTNSEKPWNWPDDRPPWSLKCPVSRLDDPPYKPISILGPRLSDKTICMVGLQMDGERNYSVYDVHNLYGWSQTLPTLEAVRNVTGERSIVISRSTFVGSGKSTGHWLGDNDSNWAHMYQSIIGLLEFNIYGIPYIGADICGYFNNVTEELCQRWMQLGAFYTFSRNHNGKAFKDQDPGAFSPDMSESSRIVLEIRYSLLPYLYTLFYDAHVHGHTVIRPVFHEFTTDPVAYDVDQQFLWGRSLLISPVLQEGATFVLAYIPNDRWFDFYTSIEVGVRGDYLIIPAPRDRIPLHIRGGSMIVTQGSANNTFHSRKNNFGLIVAPDDNNKAAGNLFWDDGTSIDTIENNAYWLLQFAGEISNEGNSTVSSSVTTSFTSLPLPPMSSIRVFGVLGEPDRAIVQFSNISTTDLSFVYNSDTKELYFYNISLPLTDRWNVIWW